MLTFLHVAAADSISISVLVGLKQICDITEVNMKHGCLEMKSRMKDSFSPEMSMVNVIALPGHYVWGP